MYGDEVFPKCYGDDFTVIPKNRKRKWKKKELQTNVLQGNLCIIS